MENDLFFWRSSALRMGIYSIWVAYAFVWCCYALLLASEGAAAIRFVHGGGNVVLPNWGVVVSANQMSVLRMWTSIATRGANFMMWRLALAKNHLLCMLLYSIRWYACIPFVEGWENSNLERYCKEAKDQQKII